MPPPAERTREKVRQHRARLRAAGLRPVQLWVPDTRTMAFRHAAQAQARAIAASAGDADDQAFIDSFADNA